MSSSFVAVEKNHTVKSVEVNECVFDDRRLPRHRWLCEFGHSQSLLTMNCRFCFLVIVFIIVFIIVREAEEEEEKGKKKRRKKEEGISFVPVLVACYATLHPALSVRLSVRPYVGPSVRHTLLFRRLWFFWLYCSCPNAQLTSNMAPAHPHATGVAVYPALFLNK